MVSFLDNVGLPRREVEASNHLADVDAHCVQVCCLADEEDVWSLSARARLALGLKKRNRRVDNVVREQHMYLSSVSDRDPHAVSHILPLQPLLPLCPK